MRARSQIAQAVIIPGTVDSRKSYDDTTGYDLAVKLEGNGKAS